jgi:hypothetical protein
VYAAEYVSRYQHRQHRFDATSGTIENYRKTTALSEGWFEKVPASDVVNIAEALVLIVFATPDEDT